MANEAEIEPDLTRGHSPELQSTQDGAQTTRSREPSATRTFSPGATKSPTSHASAPGTPAIPGYAISAEIARGGMGCVYAGRELLLDREVAIKTLLPRANAERFVRESKITAQLPHPGIPPVYSMGKLADGCPYLAMKFVRGRTLADLLDERVSPSSELPRFLQTFESICQAVGFAHSKGIIHRDLKPANVMVGAFGEVEVMDWGLAKELTSNDADLRDEAGDDADEMKTQSGSVMGTPAYMAPEQARGEEVDTGADVFALGAILSKILTGTVVFKGTTAVETVQRAANGDLGETLERLESSGADDELIRIVKKCLELEPAERYASASELTTAVADYRSGVEDRLRRAETESAAASARETEQRKRRRVIQLAVGILAAVLIAGVAVSSYFAYTSNKRADSEAAAKRDADRKTDEAVAAAGREAAQTILAGKAADTAKAEAKRAEDQTKIAEAQTELAKAQTNVAKTQTQLAEDQTKIAEGRLETSDLIAYSAKLLLAQYAFAEKNLPLALQHLDECRWDLRGWEHRYLRNLFENGKPSLVLKGHTGALDCVAVSHDGKLIVTGSSDKTLKLWDPEKGTEIRTLKGHTDRVLCVAFSPDGKRIVTGGFDKSLKVWDVDKGTEILAFKESTEIVFGLAYSADGRRIVTGGVDKKVKVWDADKGTRILTLPEQPEESRRVAFSPDGRRILTGSTGPQDATSTVWDAGKGTPLFKLKGHLIGVGCLAYSPDGQRIVTGGFDRTARIWDAETGVELHTLKGHTESLFGVAYSPDGKRIVTVSMDKSTKIWDADKGVELLTLKEESEVMHVAFSPDGKRIVTGRHNGTAKIWYADAGTEVLAFRGHMLPVSYMDISPDGRRVVTASGDRSAKIWDFEKGTEILTLKGHTEELTFVAYSADGKRIATSSYDKTAKIWDAQTGVELFTVQFKAGDFEEERVVAFSPDGKRILGIEQQRIAKVWEVEKGTVLATFENNNLIAARVAFSPDGKLIFGQSRFEDDIMVLSASDGKPATGKDAIEQWRAWCKRIGKFEEREPPSNMNGPAISPNGRFKAKPADLGKSLPGSSDYVSAIATLTRPPKDGSTWPFRDGQGMRYHIDRATLAEKENKHFAAAFHLGRLLIDDPDNPDLKKRYAAARSQLSSR